MVCSYLLSPTTLRGPGFDPRAHLFFSILPSFCFMHPFPKKANKNTLVCGQFLKFLQKVEETN